jgi:PAB1-binding protein PBP1
MKFLVTLVMLVLVGKITYLEGDVKINNKPAHMKDQITSEDAIIVSEGASIEIRWSDNTKSVCDKQYNGSAKQLSQKREGQLESQLFKDFSGLLKTNRSNKNVEFAGGIRRSNAEDSIGWNEAHQLYFKLDK